MQGNRNSRRNKSRASNHGSNSNPMIMKSDGNRDRHSEAWLKAIHQATACVRNYSETNVQELEQSLVYLGQLEALLSEKPKSMWKYPPDIDPPRLADCKTSNGLQQLDTAQAVSSTATITTSTSLVVTPMTGFSAASHNPFAVFMDSDDDDNDDSVDDKDQQATIRQSNDDGGDQIVLHYHSAPGGMDILRLVVRLSTSQSDVQACKAALLSHDREWTEGATCLQFAIIHVRTALELADTQISKWYENRVEYENEQEEFVRSVVGMASPTSEKALQAQQSQQRQKDLMQDADIVHVCIQSLLEQRERYLVSAHKEANRLRRRLQPQWQSRDEARRRMGDRWTHNPHPRNDYAELRRNDEEELRKLDQALELLSQDDTHILEATAQLLKTRLTSTKKNRYNGQRPTDLSMRIPAFPDATQYGWIFTGSADNVVEFFEKTTIDGTLVKLDFYFTTATVKTSMDHPTQGKTQLFAKKNVTPELYVQILENPRVHTNVRYQKRPRG